VHVLSWRQVDFPSVVLAGLIAGYLMALVGLWAGRVPGLVAVDIADFGRRYMVSDRPSAWFFGMGSHLVNSVLLTFAYAALIAPNLAWPTWITAPLFGVALSVILAGALIAPMSGLGVLGARTHRPAFAITTVLVHLVWGLAVGAVYVRP